MVIVAIPAISAEFDMNVKFGNLINLVFLISSISLMLLLENTYPNTVLENTLS